MKRIIFFIFFIIFPIITFAETLSVSLYVNHDEHVALSRSYKVNWQLLQLAAKSEGITLIAKEQLWIRGLNAIKEKKVDALIGGYFSDERENYSYFSRPFSLDYLFLYSKNNTHVSLEDINKQKVILGVTTKSFAEKIANQVGFRNIYLKSSSEEVFELLIKDRLDYAIFTESLANKHCELKRQKIPNQDCIYPVEPPLINKTVHTLYSKIPRVINLAKRIDLAVEKFIVSGEVKKLLLAANYSEQEYSTWLKIRHNWINNID